MVDNTGRRPAPHASDPSLETMLRRARDARLGDELDTPDTAVWSPPPPHSRRWLSLLRDWALFSAGLLVGLLVALSVAQSLTLAHTITSWTSPSAASSPPATPSPTPTATIPPALTAASTATPQPYPPPTTVEIVALVQAFYDTQGPFAGTDVLRDVTNMRVERLDSTELGVCIAYEAAAVSAPDTVIGSNVRLFTLEVTSDDTWEVVQMGAVDSCNLG